MRSQILSIAAGCLLFLAWSPAQAQDWGRAHRTLDKTQEDLRHIEHHDVWAAEDRGHYEAAERNINDIRRDLDRNRLDRGKLDATIAEVEHITHVDAVPREPRERLNEDLRELRRLREEWHWK